MCQLYNATPKDLVNPTLYRKDDTDEVAFVRGEEFHDRIYRPNPSYDENANRLAAPDYHYIVRSMYLPLNPQQGPLFELKWQTTSTAASSRSMGY